MHDSLAVNFGLPVFALAKRVLLPFTKKAQNPFDRFNVIRHTEILRKPGIGQFLWTKPLPKQRPIPNGIRAAVALWRRQ
jgi:hypothetical protein